MKWTEILFALQFEPTLKVFSYHVLYSGSNLIADIGGYLGLFLGLSAFGLVELFSKIIQQEKPKKVMDLAKNTATILNQSIKM